MQDSGHLSQQETQFVADDVDLLLGFHTVLSRCLQEELRGDLLQGGDLLLPATQLLLQHLKAGGDREQESVHSSQD